MELFKLLQKKSKFFYLYLAMLGLINGVWASALLLFINNKIVGEPLPFIPEYDWMVYVGLIIVSFTVARFFQAYMIKLTYGLGNELNLSIFDKLRFSSYQEFQKLGEDKVRTAMTDVSTLQKFPQSFIESFNAAIMVVIGVVYLFIINSIGASLILLALVVLASVYYVRSISIENDLNKARDLANVYQDNVNDFLRGYKEMKMSTKRSDVIYNNYLKENRGKVKDLTIVALTKHLVNELMANYAWYLGIGIILFVLPAAIVISKDANVTFMVTLLYLLGPVNVVVSSIHDFTAMKVAVNRLKIFNKVINASENIALGHGDMTDFNVEFESIRFENVTFEYRNEEKGEVFKLQPLNLVIEKGESIFITGGNGSGKSTFIQLLTGLYTPTSGNIYLNERKINKENYPYYRDQISCIFTDNYLFSENYNNFDFTEVGTDLEALVTKMELDGIFAYDRETGRVKTKLSKGQQKRVALIYSLLEKKDVIILDEWAAEQDPVFREYFYRTIIPELKEMGKTLVAVTHDDAYFDCAERTLKFNFGSIIEDTKFSTEKTDQLIENEVPSV
ncbi:ATP-binding cassette domain-containing protein [Flavobacteriaceae bacterium M23B6Z8]